MTGEYISALLAGGSVMHGLAGGNGMASMIGFGVGMVALTYCLGFDKQDEENFRNRHQNDK